MYPRPLPLYPPTTTKKWKESRMCGSGAKCGGGGMGRAKRYIHRNYFEFNLESGFVDFVFFNYG